MGFLEGSDGRAWADRSATRPPRRRRRGLRALLRPEGAQRRGLHREELVLGPVGPRLLRRLHDARHRPTTARAAGSGGPHPLGGHRDRDRCGPATWTARSSPASAPPGRSCGLAAYQQGDCARGREQPSCCEQGRKVAAAATGVIGRDVRRQHVPGAARVPAHDRRMHGAVGQTAPSGFRSGRSGCLRQGADSGHSRPRRGTRSSRGGRWWS